MKKLKVGINGFGRIGRVATRLLWKKEEFELVAINDLSPIATNAHLLKYDSVHGPWDVTVTSEAESLIIGGKKVLAVSQKDPAQIPWKALGVDLVFECTGAFTSFEGASKHLQAGAKKVIISAPAKDNDKVRTFVYGINHERYSPASDDVVSNASCTTNCLAPVVKVLHDHFKIKHGLMTTIHSYTNDQKVLDIGHTDIRRARAAGLNMIPTTTGAAKAVSLVIPDLKGKLTGLSVRVPTPNVSLVDFVAEVEKNTSTEEVNNALLAASQSEPLKGILQATPEKLVSSDFNGSFYSSIVDMDSTLVVDGQMIKVFSWYDNETGFSMRMLDLAQWMGRSF